jgi:hypothetical protein
LEGNVESGEGGDDEPVSERRYPAERTFNEHKSRDSSGVSESVLLNYILVVVRCETQLKEQRLFLITRMIVYGGEKVWRLAGSGWR